MKRKRLLDLLMAHAESLNHCRDVDSFDVDHWLTTHSPEVAQIFSLLSLLRVAQALKKVLVPVSPPEPFRSELRDQLEQVAIEKSVDRPQRRFVWWGAAVIGSLLSITGLVLLLLRRLKLIGSQSPPMTTAV